MAMRVREFAKTVDHTLLKPDATEEQIARLCEEAAHYHFAAVCIPPCYVRLAARELRGTDVKVATVISFPFGNDATAVKTAAVREAITRGASELDVVLNVSKLLSGQFDYVADELASLTQEVSVVAINNGLNDVVMKVIIETAYLTDKMKRLATQIVAASGADFVKTSTGFGPGGATVEDVALLREEAPESLAVKASGGIRTLEDALDILNAGASRLGMSASVAVMGEAEGGGLQE
ncbi:MAG: Deoxyribose-phosphate aldolase [uncultured Rubrobacteraceae bacterium]|uniref:Deoxyribose-phosphate aldolase n=1 Tax=uncultured Rubrobacteraceae bacterium TaxID=349277 RepID=A0A6J4Q7I8_9ACTN|nr:MAG: Deoxyribose-phosphate aldolase [uncultured Rubrobacteraceae bacterium]